MPYKVPFYTTLTEDNEKFVRSLPRLMDEDTISEALNRLLVEVRKMHQKRTMDLLLRQ